MVTTDGQRDEMLSLDSSTQNAKGSFFKILLYTDL